MNRKFESASILVPTPEKAYIVLGRVEGGLGVDIDWENRVIHFFADYIEEATPEQAKEVSEKQKTFRPRKHFVEVAGNLRRIRGIDVDCSDVAKAGGCEACCSCDSEKSSPPEAYSTSPCESNNCPF